MEKANLKSASELAFIGDAVHTLFVRKNVLIAQGTIKAFNKKCSRYCSARYQSKILDKIFDKLTESEQDIVRRGRNLDSKSRAKNATVEEYRKATAFEALMGYLYLDEQNERLHQLLLISMEEI